MTGEVELAFSFSTTNTGWATCVLRIGATSVEIGPFSQAITDGLDDLFRSTLLMATGAYRASFSMDDEPEPKWLWALVQDRQYHPTREVLTVTVSRLHHWDDETGRIVLHATCDTDDFGFAVLAAGKALLADAREGNLDRWGPLPTRAISALEAALATKKAYKNR